VLADVDFPDAVWKVVHPLRGNSHDFPDTVREI
jgi:hypothetical protein